MIINEGDIITIDGGTGDVILGAAPLVDAEMSGDLAEFLGMADKFRKNWRLGKCGHSSDGCKGD